MSFSIKNFKQLNHPVCYQENARNVVRKFKDTMALVRIIIAKKEFKYVFIFLKILNDRFQILKRRSLMIGFIPSQIK